MIQKQLGGSLDMPLVSVVMSFRNARRTLRAAINSVLWQTYTHWELILLDDGSSDGSEQILKEIKDTRIRAFRDTQCRGLPFQLNKGVSFSQGEYMARMDADDVAFPERFERQVAFLRANPSVDLLATSALMINEANEPFGILRTGNSHDDICHRPWLGFPMPHPTWMGRTEWFRRNPYNEWAHKCEDQVLLHRTYRYSTFAGLAEPLLAYRYARLSVEKSLVGRWYYLQAMKKANDRNNFILGSMAHTVAAGRDLLSIAFGLDSLVIKGRVGEADADVVRKWHEMQLRLEALTGQADV
ncbi:MAG: glycosyltransferase family 2 protein [Pseudomonadota bacterium]